MQCISIVLNALISHEQYCLKAVKGAPKVTKTDIQTTKLSR